MKFPDPFLQHAALERGMTSDERWKAFMDSIDLWEALVSSSGPEALDRALALAETSRREMWGRLSNPGHGQP